MAEIKWIKMSVDIFNNRKIRQIENMPQGDGIIAIWLKILCLAGTVNDSGMIYLTRDIPYNDATLSTEFNRPLPLVQLALATFQQFGMIEIVNDFICVSNWEKYQSVDKMLEIREYNRIAQQRSREKRKLLNAVNDISMTSQPCHDTDKEVDKEVDKEKESIIADKPRKQRKVKIEFIPPTFDEVKAYITEKGYSVNPKTFYDYFTAGEPKWVDKNGTPVLNWKQKIVTWASREKEKPKTPNANLPWVNPEDIKDGRWER